jgi:hemerythrin-like domain-containing protein
MATDDTAVGTSEDAIDMLMRDHRIVKELFKEFAKKDGKARNPLIEEICTKLTIHTALEEELFYPAVRNEIRDDNLMNEAVIEHATARHIIKQLLPVQDDDEYVQAKVTVLREYIKHHINEEESEMFPKVKQTKLDLKSLGRQMMDRRVALQEQLTTPDAVVAFASL